MSMLLRNKHKHMWFEQEKRANTAGKIEKELKKVSITYIYIMN